MFKKPFTTVLWIFATTLKPSSKLKTVRIRGYTQIMSSKIHLANEYYVKIDFQREKIFIACALVKNKVEKIRLFIQTHSLNFIQLL